MSASPMSASPMSASPMSAALAILLGLLSLCPAIVTVDGPFLPCLIPFMLAAGLILVSANLAPGEAQHLSNVVSRPLFLVAAFPAVLMILQILPIPLGGRRGLAGGCGRDQSRAG